MDVNHARGRAVDLEERRSPADLYVDAGSKRQMILRFDDFELDSQQCQLSRCGEVIRLEKLPMDLLILLVDRRGALVKREEIAAALWGATAFVDEEHGISTAIRKIRGALGDDPAAPRYIETVVRRGYRFKGEVLAVVDEQTNEAVTAPESSPSPRVRPIPARWIVGGVVGGAAILLALV